MRDDAVEFDTKYKVGVMQAWLDGEEIEVKSLSTGNWIAAGLPLWDWANCIYRVKEVKPLINWEHVADEYNYLSVDKMGVAYLYEKCPVIDDYEIGVWATTSGGFSTAVTHKSLVLPDHLDWENSLVERPNTTEENRNDA